MTVARFLMTILCIPLLLSVACTVTEEDQIEDRVHELVDALNDSDVEKASALFTEQTIEPLTDSGDSSTVFRLFTVYEGEDYEAVNIRSAVIGEVARTEFDLVGDMMTNTGSYQQMVLHLLMELERSGDSWQFISGAESQSSGL